jgi:1,4-alpha-glucan branching enzyme
MKSPRHISLLALLLLPFIGISQIISSEPALPNAEKALKIFYDATLGTAGLEDYTGDVYTHTGVLTSKSSGGTDWRYVKTEWCENTPETKLTRVSENLYSLEISPSIREYYGVPDEEKITHVAFVFRNSDGSLEGKDENGTDILVEVFPKGLEVSIINPDQNLLIDPGSIVDFQAAASELSELTLFQNDSTIKSLNGESITHSFSFPSPGDFWLKVTALSGEKSVADSVFIHAIEEQVNLPVPGGLVDGINYIDDHTVQLVLYAPYKERVFVLGDFNNWFPNSASRMKKEGDRWWVTLNNLNPGQEYGFQYQVDGELVIADPYTEKTLDPNDRWITEATYPDLKPYPTGLTTGITSVLQTDQKAYEWKNASFDAPPQEELVIYELLVRDFIAAHDWKTLTDTLNYLSELGINAIELMPINEFEGNESWGYNTSFYFAPDKYYGPAEDLKIFIDSCHGRGIAVIIDMVLNHSFSQSPLVQLYFENGQVTDENPWYNVSSPNPVYFWGYDFNHESPHTKEFVDRVNAHWINEYHIDGYRFDFTKGFTNKPGDGWGYDASRIAILKRMATAIWTFDNDAYVILEHLTDNSEEAILADFGMMLWGNMNFPYNEATMGYHENNKSNFGGISYLSRGWNEPHLVGYMESHDEERLMYKNLEHGSASGDYNIKELNTALERMELAGAFFFTVPGPKMIWQFGELGYDYSIDYDCRVCNKPIRWDYNTGLRKRISQVWGSLIKLRKSEAAFRSNDFRLAVAGPGKRIEINHPDMDVRIIGNFDVSQITLDANFSQTGWWYDYFSGDSISVSNLHEGLPLNAGEFRIYTTKRLLPPKITVSLPGIKYPGQSFAIYPNPVTNQVWVEAWEVESQISVHNLSGLELISNIVPPFEKTIDLSSLPKGVFIISRYAAGRGKIFAKILKISQ